MHLLILVAKTEYRWSDFIRQNCIRCVSKKKRKAVCVSSSCRLASVWASLHCVAFPALFISIASAEVTDVMDECINKRKLDGDKSIVEPSGTKKEAQQIEPCLPPYSREAAPSISEAAEFDGIRI